MLTHAHKPRPGSEKIYYTVHIQIQIQIHLHWVENVPADGTADGIEGEAEGSAGDGFGGDSVGFAPYIAP